MNIVLLGSKGQLGNRFLRFFKGSSHKLIPISRQECNLTQKDQFFALLKNANPNIIINTAAYNSVDQAETNQAEAWQVNCELPHWLAEWIDSHPCRLVHYSTDYVFDGRNRSLYTEDHEPNPLNVYGHSKWAGEKILLKSSQALIFRVSWVFGGHRQNFLLKLDQWLKEGRDLSIACDEVSVPTSVDTIIVATWLAIQKELCGLYHLVNHDCASRWEWARFYLRQKNINRFIYPAYQADFPLPAPRPRFSAMSNQKLERDLNITLPSWQEELKRLVKNPDSVLWNLYDLS
ncbi:MAG: dTDP-4-dehydrorhamnose reductase [Bdellovibrionaceae bacterium]|nr:dTDP-4-dehydrorhamnose reductase [Pseudobdellovibrionaceae bacterium]